MGKLAPLRTHLRNKNKNPPLMTRRGHERWMDWDAFAAEL
jgi:hypothetical protein